MGTIHDDSEHAALVLRAQMSWIGDLLDQKFHHDGPSGLQGDDAASSRVILVGASARVAGIPTHTSELYPVSATPLANKRISKLAASAIAILQSAPAGRGGNAAASPPSAWSNTHHIMAFRSSCLRSRRLFSSRVMTWARSTPAFLVTHNQPWRKSMCVGLVKSVTIDAGCVVLCMHANITSHQVREQRHPALITAKCAWSSLIGAPSQIQPHDLQPRAKPP